MSNLSSSLTNEILTAEPIAYDASVNHFLLPLQAFLSNPQITEICVNSAGLVFIELPSCCKKINLPELSSGHLNSLSIAVATASKTEINSRMLLIFLSTRRMNGFSSSAVKVSCLFAKYGEI